MRQLKPAPVAHQGDLVDPKALGQDANLLSNGFGVLVVAGKHPHRHWLTPVPEMGLAVLRVPVSCSNGLSGAIVLTRGYQEPDLDTKPGGKIKATSPWTGFFTTDLSLTAPEMVKKYRGRWAIEVFFNEAKQRLGLGQEQGHSFAAQVFSVIQTFFRYSLLVPVGLTAGERRTVPDHRRSLSPTGRGDRQNHFFRAPPAIPLGSLKKNY